MDDQLYTVIARILSGEASEQEQLGLKDWLTADPERIAAYEEIRQLWEQADDLVAGTRFDTSAAWQKVAARAGIIPRKRNTHAFIPAWAKISFAAAATIMGIFLYLYVYTAKTIRVAALQDNLEISLP